MCFVLHLTAFGFCPDPRKTFSASCCASYITTTHKHYTAAPRTLSSIGVSPFCHKNNISDLRRRCLWRASDSVSASLDVPGVYVAAAAAARVPLLESCNSCCILSHFRIVSGLMVLAFVVLNYFDPDQTLMGRGRSRYVIIGARCRPKGRILFSKFCCATVHLHGR